MNEITLSEEQLDLLASKIVEKLVKNTQEEENKKIKQSLERAKMERSMQERSMHHFQ